MFGWGPTELGLFGILLTVTGTAGALVGGRLDDRVGAKPGDPRRDRRCSASSASASCRSGATTLLFVVATAPPSPDDGLYGTAPEKMFLALGLVIGAVAGPAAGVLAQPSRPACPGGARPGRYFGLLALSGKVTSFLAPLAGGARDGRLPARRPRGRRC